METVKLIIKRQSSFVALAMPYRITVNGREMGKVSNGKTLTLEIPNQRSVMLVEMVGNSMNFHRMFKEAGIFPSYAQHGTVECTIRTKLNWVGFLTLGLAQAVGQIDIDVKYP